MKNLIVFYIYMKVSSVTHKKRSTKTLRDLFQHSDKCQHYEIMKIVNQSLRLKTSTTKKKEKPAFYFYESNIQLTFSDKSKNNSKFVFKIYKFKCDVVLPNIKNEKISRRHCYFNFNVYDWLILRNTSIHETIVTYDKKKIKRRKFTWILKNHNLADDAKTIVIEFHKIFTFQIIVKKRKEFSHLYNDNINQFFKAKKVTINELSIDKFDRFDIQNEKSIII